MGNLDVKYLFESQCELIEKKGTEEFYKLKG